MSTLPSDIISSILIAINYPTDVLAASQVCRSWRYVFANPQYGVCRHHCQKLWRPQRKLIFRFKCWTESHLRDSVDNWNAAFVSRLIRDARCRIWFEKVVNGRTGTISNIEELVTLGSEAKEV